MDTGGISGHVVDAVSQTPVGGAHVTLVAIVEADGGVETVAGREPVVVVDTPSRRQPIEIHVIDMDADVTGVRVVATL